MGSESLKNTPFEKEITAVFYLKKKGDSKLGVSPGVYNLALFWHEAVKLRLRTDWMEPAHPVYQLQSELMGMRGSPQSTQAMSQAIQSQPWMEPVHPHTPWMEPAHYPGFRPWLEPAHPVFQTAADLKKAGEAKTFEHTEPVQYLNQMNQIIQERSILVSAIDEVYPELKLGERLNKAQYVMSPTLPLPPPRAWPGVREPAHMMGIQQWASGPHPEPWKQAMTEIAQVISRYGPSPEPWKQAMTEIAQVISRYGPRPEPWRDQMLSEIANVLSSFSYEMLNPQPLPPKSMMDWSGVREPAHPMATMKPEMPQQMLSDMAAVLRRYGFQI